MASANVCPGNWSGTVSVTAPITSGTISLFRKLTLFPQFQVLFNVAATPSFTFQELNENTGAVISLQTGGAAFQVIPTTSFFVDVCVDTIAFYTADPQTTPSIVAFTNPGLECITRVSGLATDIIEESSQACCNSGCKSRSRCRSRSPCRSRCRSRSRSPCKSRCRSRSRSPCGVRNRCCDPCKIRRFSCCNKEKCCDRRNFGNRCGCGGGNRFGGCGCGGGSRCGRVRVCCERRTCFPSPCGRRRGHGCC